MSFSVTSFNAERAFSMFKRIYGDTRQRLKDSTAFSTASIRSVNNSNLNIDLHGDFEMSTLNEIRGIKKVNDSNH